MDRKGAYMKPGARPSAPGVVFTVHVVSRNRPVRATNRTVAARFALAHLTRSVFRRGRWGPLKTATADTPEAAREWLARNAVAGRTNWVVPANAEATLTLLRWWSYAENCGIVMVERDKARAEPPRRAPGDGTIYLKSLVVRTGTTVVAYTQYGVSWRWVSGRQYLPGGLDAAGGPGTEPAAGAGTAAGPEPVAGEPADRTAARWSEWFRALCDFWRSRARAPFGSTVGQLAIGMLRSHVEPKLLCTHSDGDAHALERSAAFGGRATLWFVGRVLPQCELPVAENAVEEAKAPATEKGPLTHVDVRSMYPYLLRDMVYPVKIKSVVDGAPVRDVLELARDFPIIARVTIETEVPEYPHRTGDRVEYPVGRFATTLTGPELLRLSSEGRVIACHQHATYNAGRPFASAAGALLELRQEYDRAGNARDATFAKLLANALGGKLAQRAGGWVRWADEDTPGRWGEEHRYDTRTDKRTRVRFLAGLCWRWADDKSGRGPYTFAFAYLAAYGRLMMRHLREQLPARSVVSQDTDGLWVLPPALEALAALNEPQGTGPGSIRVTDTAVSARFWGPRHYVTDDRWTLAGFAQPYVREDGCTVQDVYDASVWSQRCPTAPTETHKIVRQSVLKVQDVGGDVGPDGWVVPRRAGRSVLPPAPG